MRSRAFLNSLLAAAISISPVVAGEDAKKPRQEKNEHVLTDLERACRKMLNMQIGVQNGVKTLHASIEGNGDKKPRPSDKEAALELADNMKAIIKEVNKAIAKLEADGAAVAFPEVFRQLRDDMKNMQGRLETGDAGTGTQAIGEDIIDALREMIEPFR